MLNNQYPRVSLELNSESHLITFKNRFQSHKVKKRHLSETPRILRIENALQKIELNDLLTESLAFDSRPNEISDQKANKTSSYLAYKQHQKNIYSKDNNKISFPNDRYLGFSRSPAAIQKQFNSAMLVKTRKNTRSTRKMGLIVLGEIINEVKNQKLLSIKRSRGVYIKTAQGKRQEIDTNNQISKMQRPFADSSVNFLYSMYQLQQNKHKQFNPDINQKMQILHFTTYSRRHLKKQDEIKQPKLNIKFPSLIKKQTNSSNDLNGYNYNNECQKNVERFFRVACCL